MIENFWLPYRYDIEKGSKYINNLNRVLNPVGVSFYVSQNNEGHKQLNISVDEKKLEKVTSLKSRLGRPIEHKIDFNLIEQMQAEGKKNKEIYAELGISKSLFYKRMREHIDTKESKING